MNKERNESFGTVVPEKKKLIVYLHGYGSSGESSTVKHLRKIMPKYDVLAPDIPVNPAEVVIE